MLRRRAAARLRARTREGWGQVVLEAAAHGVPTLARDVPGLRDSIRDGVTGWLVDGAGRVRPADRLDDVLADGLVTALDQHGRNPTVRAADRRRVPGLGRRVRLGTDACGDPRRSSARAVSMIDLARVAKLLRARG